jgi:CheY-like chemotaxis protein
VGSRERDSVHVPNTILVVDDEKTVRETVREVLEDEGYAVVEAANGQEALSYLQRGPKPCLVLLDLMMPVMSGFDFLDVVKNDPVLKSTSILLVSAASREKIEQARKASTAVGVLVKPLQLKPLLDAVARYC